MSIEVQKSDPAGEEIEKNKDFSDLKPALDFVSRYQDIYDMNLGRLFERKPDSDVEKWVEGIAFTNVCDDESQQLPPELAKKVLSRLPKGLAKISGLKEINYQYQKLVPIPNYGPDGFLARPPCLETVPLDQFPAEKYHPTRVLIGNSYKGTISPSPVPATVSKDPRAIRNYQVHVFLHEFMHTIEERFRSNQRGPGLLMAFPDGTVTSFGRWRSAFLGSMLDVEPQFTSDYASSYSDRITKGMDQSDIALAEQICETFAAYMLDIAPSAASKDEYESFSFHDFQSRNPLAAIRQDISSLRHHLMDRFVKAEFDVLD